MNKYLFCFRSHIGCLLFHEVFVHHGVKGIADVSHSY